MADLDDATKGISTSMEKWLTQLAKVEERIDRIIQKVPDIASGMQIPGGGSGGNFGGGFSSTGMGMPQPSFGGQPSSSGPPPPPSSSSGPAGPAGPSGPTTTSQSSTPFPKEGRDWKGIGLGALSAVGAVGKFAWQMTPGVEDAFTNRQAMFPAAMFGDTVGYDKGAFGKVRAAFGDTATGKFDQQAAASMLTMSGISVGSERFNRVAGEAGFLSKMTGSSNLQTSQAMMSLTSGAGVAGKLMQYGIFTTDLGTGQGRGIGDVIDQLWERWYGSKNAKVDKAVFDADLLGGFLGQDLMVLFGDQPELYNQIKYALQLKAKANGKSGIDFSEKAKGPNSANALAKKYGMDEMTNPQQKMMEVYSSEADAIERATDPLLTGFNAASDIIIGLNKTLANLDGAAGDVYDELLKTKGFLETLNSNTGGAAGFGLALAAAVTALKALSGGVGGIVKAVKDAVTAVKGGASVGQATKAAAAGLGKAAAGRAGVIGAVTTGVELGYNYKQAWDTEGWTGVRNYAGQVSMPGLLWGMMPNNDSGFWNKGREAAENARDSGEGFWGILGAGLEAGNPLRYHSEDAPGGDGYMPSDNSGKGSSKSLLDVDASKAVDWAANKAGNKGKKWPSMCDRFVANAYGIPRSGYDSARVHWQSIPDRYRHHDDTNPPVGALTFWNNGQWGHVAIVTGTKDGEAVITTTHTQGGTPVEMTLSEATRQLGGKGMYLGWTDPYFHGKIATLSGAQAAANAQTGTGDVDASEASNPYGTTILPQLQRLGAEDMANPMSNNSGLSAITVFGGGAPAVDDFGSATDDKDNPTRTSDTQNSKSQTPVTANLKGGAGKLIGWLQQAGFKGDKLRTAWAVAMRESGGRPSAFNGNQATGDMSYGLFQINMLGKLGPDRRKKYGLEKNDELLNPVTNARVAYKMTNKGTNWFSWDIDENGYDGGSHSAKFREWYDKFPTYARKAGLPGYQHGVDYVEKDQVANLHRGNMVFPADLGDEFRTAVREYISGNRQQRGDVNITLKIEKASDEEATRFAKKVMSMLKDERRMERMKSR